MLYYGNEPKTSSRHYGQAYGIIKWESIFSCMIWKGMNQHLNWEQNTLGMFSMLITEAGGNSHVKLKCLCDFELKYT